MSSRPGGASGTGAAPRGGTPARPLVAACAVLGAIGCLVASLLTWLRLPDGEGGVATVSGWGTVGGGSQIAGQNLNDAMNGNATFRPGTLPVLIGGLALLAGLGVALVARGPKPHRIPGAVLALCGAGALAWGVLRVLRPDSVGLLQPGEGSAGAGPWLTAGSGVVLLAVAVVLLLGLLDPPPPLPRRGIQPAGR